MVSIKAKKGLKGLGFSALKSRTRLRPLAPATSIVATKTGRQQESRPDSTSQDGLNKPILSARRTRIRRTQPVIWTLQAAVQQRQAQAQVELRPRYVAEYRPLAAPVKIRQRPKLKPRSQSEAALAALISKAAKARRRAARVTPNPHFVAGDLQRIVPIPSGVKNIQHPKLNVRGPSQAASGIWSKISRSIPRIFRHKSNSREYGDIHTLQSMLELGDVEHQIPDVTFLSLDLEWVTYTYDHITEIGITTLSMKDLKGVPFGPYGNGWLSKMQHHHIVIPERVKASTTYRMHNALFATSQKLNSIEARQHVLQIIESLAPEGSSGRLVIVGQSVGQDINKLHDDQTYGIDIKKITQANLPFHKIIDTYDLAIAASKRGTKFSDKKLASIARKAGIDPMFHGNLPGSLRRVHNASNDAVYSLMAALLMAMRWNDLIGPQSRRVANTVLWDESHGTRLPDTIAAKELRTEEMEEIKAETRQTLIKLRTRTHRSRREARKEAITRAVNPQASGGSKWLNWLKRMYSAKSP